MEYELVVVQNAELERLRANLADLPVLKEKHAKCKELSERLALAERWRSRIRGIDENFPRCGTDARGSR